MGVITKQPCPQELVACEKKKKREQKMCNTRQQEPQQNQSWQGAYPDLSALNELFSPQAAVNSEQQPSPWIAFLNSLGLQPIPASQPAQQQAQPTQDQPSAPPAPETQQQDGQTFAGTNSPPPPPAHRAGRPPPLLRHHLPPALPAQAARARPASGRPRKLGRSLHQHCLGPISKPQPPPSLNLYWNVLNHKSIVYVL